MQFYSEYPYTRIKKSSRTIFWFFHLKESLIFLHVRFTRKILCKYLLLSLGIRQSIHKITKKTYKLLFLVELVIAGSEIWFSFFDTNSRQDNLSIRIFRISSNFLFDSFYLCQIILIYHCKIYLTCCATGSRMASIVFVWNTGIVIFYYWHNLVLTWNCFYCL